MDGVIIWTEDQESVKIRNVLNNPKGKTCGNCFWGDGILEEEDKSMWVVCSHHPGNFIKNSLCMDWADPKDPAIQVYNENKFKK